jgi:hypothetical protein
MHENDEFAETFVPELCRLSGYNHLVTAEMWLKAIFLPSILQRTTILLNAEDLRTSINSYCKIGQSNGALHLQDFVPHAQQAAPVVPVKKNKAQGFGLPKFTCKVPNVNETFCPWTENEPANPDYLLDEGVTWGQLEEFGNFAYESLNSAESEIPSQSSFVFVERFDFLVCHENLFIYFLHEGTFPYQQCQLKCLLLLKMLLVWAHNCILFMQQSRLPQPTIVSTWKDWRLLGTLT